jgi:hypothetical protein
MNRGTGAASAMFFYAMLMVGAGVTAFALAPETANAKTALIVPVACAGAMVLCAILSLQIERAKVLGMIGIHMGLIFPILFAGVIGFRAVATGEKVAQYKVAELEYATALEQREVDNGAGARTAFFTAREAPDHDKSYLRNTLWFLTIASLGSFGLILAKRPKKEDRGA